MPKSTKNLISLITVFTLYVLSFLAFKSALDLFAKTEDEIPTALTVYIVLTFVLFGGGLYLYRFTLKNNEELIEETKGANAMSQYFVGELGYEHDAEFTDRSAAENAAVEHSIAAGQTAISIRNEHNEVVSVVVVGEIFDKRE